MLTIIEASLKVWVGPVLHQHALGLLRIECHFRCLGAHQLDELGCILVLLPIAGGQVVVGIGGMEVEVLMVWGGGLLWVASGGF